MKIAYTAHTETCTLLLDGEGICRSVLAASEAAVANGYGRTTRIPTSAEKCIGAQYVATIDIREPGGMVPLPKVGAQMLFARTEKNGRITLVRSAPVLRFDAAGPVVESGVHARPDDTDTLAAVRPDIELPDDDEPTISQSSAFRPSVPPAPSGERRSSLPPPRSSGVVPAAKRATRMTPIPPPPPMPRVTSPDSETRPIPAVCPPSLPKRPSVVRVSAPDWELATKPFRRAAR